MLCFLFFHYLPKKKADDMNGGISNCKFQHVFRDGGQPPHIVGVNN